ncbi:hypothetical protein ACHAWU_007917 [Discostella pseudostelligera]|uniref:Uncharacterized protein n=1 Tax=Discostella pseudostelligera TaxID=259834 RepID=A0ABD3MFX1_9STRA
MPLPWMLPLRSLSLIFPKCCAAAADDDAAAADDDADDDAAVAAEVAALVADAAAGDVDSNFVVLGYHITGIPNAASDNDNVISREKHTRMTEALLRVRDGEALSTLRHEFPQIHKWNKSFSVIVSGSSRVLVARPKDSVGVDVDNDTVFRVTFLERVFADLLVGHGTDHTRGRTLYSRMAGVITNCPRNVCKMFTDLCPDALNGMRESMPDGEFRFLLNYVDHGIKYLFSVPIVRKRASCIALALFQIFTMIGPPMILQSDNGSEMYGPAEFVVRYKGQVDAIDTDDEDLDEVEEEEEEEEEEAVADEVVAADEVADEVADVVEEAQPMANGCSGR